MAVKETTGEMDAFLKGASTLARIPLGEAAAGVIGAKGGHVEILQLRQADADYAVVLHGAGLFEREMLCTADDLPQMLQISYALTTARDAACVELTRGALGILSRPGEPHEMTPAQVAVCETYADGDFSYLPEMARTYGVRAYDRALKTLGDGLFSTIIRELDPREGCDSDEEATRRMATMSDDLIKAEAAVQGVENAAPAP